MTNFWKRVLGKKKNPPAKAELIFAFEFDGLKYYKAPEELSMGVERVGKIQEYMIWMKRGLTDSEMGGILDNMDKLIWAGLQNGKNAAKLSVLINELRERKEKVVPTEIFYNYLACYYIREDEDPMRFNHQIQAEKVEAFKKASHDEASFFFSMPEWMQLSSSLSITTANWQLLQEGYLRGISELEEILKLTLPDTSSP